MSPQAHRSIGEVLHVLESDFPDVTISKIRFLESQGLLNPERTPSGYRKFFEDDVERLRWVLVQQRDHFLPLRVIKARLDAGDWRPVAEGGEPSETGAASTPTANGVAASAAQSSPERFAPQPAAAAQAPAPAQTAPAQAAAPVKHRPLDRGPTERTFSINELADAAKLDISAIRDLHKFGVLEPVSEDPPVFDGDNLIIAKAAAGFMDHGLEARHLKAWRIAAEREAGTMEQLAVPMSLQSSAGSKGRAVDLANDLVTLGGELREAMIRRYLRASLGLD